MQTSKFQVWLCPGCGLRFSTLLDQEAPGACPTCGEALEQAGFPYSSQPIGRMSMEQDAGLQQEVLLDNIRSAWNVGSIFRTAEGAGVAHVYLCGITPTPQNDKVAKTALGAEGRVSWSYHTDGLAQVENLRQSGRLVWCLEGGPAARPLAAAPPLPDGTTLVWVFGSEVGGVDPELMAACHACWYIPLAGYKESLNIAVACGIALFAFHLWEQKLQLDLPRCSGA
jgi:23S rRNA (guanosine2251-2'-O)-methyltransferase